MKKIWIAAIAALFCLTACVDSASNPTEGDGQNKDNGPCSFTKTDNVWQYTYSTWKYTNKYTWIDETTVKYEEYAKSYHMEESDSIMTDQNRDELFETVMEDCLYYTNEDNL